MKNSVCKRFLKYVAIHTTSSEESGRHPSDEREFVLANLLVKELHELRIEASVDENCYVYASIPAAPGFENAPKLGFLAHMDTSPDAEGNNVKPQLHPNYSGKDVVLLNGTVLDTQRFPFLKKMKGQTLITGDGTTLLGADDKAGIAEIMAAAEIIVRENVPHGKIQIAFTPDEEIGQGTDFFDVKKYDADFAYTVDGGDVGDLEYENFNAAGAIVSAHGFSVHPGEAKNLMVNAQNVAMEFHAALPENERPEHTEGRQGFFHLTGMTGNISDAKLNYIIRDHDSSAFSERKKKMQEIAQTLNQKYGEGTVQIEISDSYYNMLEKIKPHWHLIENARAAIHLVGLEPREIPIRGGTDGAMLSFKGLPCPNLGTGGFNFHGNCECITVEKMEQSVKVLLELVKIYAKGL